MKPLFDIFEVIGRRAGEFVMLDVGAMWLGEQEVQHRNLLTAPEYRVFGFDAIKEECDKLNAMGMKNHTFLPYAVGDGSERTFYQTNTNMTSSLYEPNTALLDRFNLLGELTRVVATSTMKTRRLDDLPEIKRFDFAKIDVQGAELDVLRGAERLLIQALVLELEVEFVEMYKGQPLFADVDTYLRRQGFCFHRMGDLMGRTFKPLSTGDDAARLSQGIWTNAVYVKDFMRLRSLSPEQLLRYAAIVHQVYGSYDLAAFALQHYDLMVPEGQRLWKAYVRRLLGGAEPPEPPPLHA